jgi:hypothetical protein
MEIAAERVHRTFLLDIPSKCGSWNVRQKRSANMFGGNCHVTVTLQQIAEMQNVQKGQKDIR